MTRARFIRPAGLARPLRDHNGLPRPWPGTHYLRAVRRTGPLRAVRSTGPASVAALGGGVAAAALYAANVSPVADAVAFGAVGLGSVAALLTGPRWHRAQPRQAWPQLAAACALFLVGALLRPWATDQHGAQALAADAFTVPGYLFMLLGLISLLRARGGIDRHAVIDGFIVFLGAGLASTLLLAIPGAASQRQPTVAAVVGLYPTLDVLLVLVLVNLAFTTAVRRPGYLLLLATMGLLFAGDLAYAVISVAGQLTGSRLLDLPFLLGYATIGAAALHPSVVDLGRATRPPAQPWSWPRLLLVGPALAAPFALLAALPDQSLAQRLVLGAGGAAMTALLCVRAVSAVQGYAAAQRRYEHQASHDPLTGLPNRLMLSAQVQRLLSAPPPERPEPPEPPGLPERSGPPEPPGPPERSGPPDRPGLPEPPGPGQAAGREPSGSAQPPAVWVFFLDLDGFKLVNDSWGHQAGDQVIIEVARRLRATVPPASIVARVGGDEFVLAHVGPRQAAIELVEQVLDCLAEPLRMPGAEVVISASVGIAGGYRGSSPAQTAESLMRDADTAMYQAKSEGRGKWTVFDASMHERVRERVEIELALRHALTGGQLHLAYQPIVELSTGRLLGAEALIRWEHPLRGSVPPSAFIPIAEDTGLVSALGTWVLHEALRQLAAWRAVGAVSRDFWMSVNVSPRQLRDPTLPRRLAEALRQYEVPATAVVLEITESVMVDANGVTDQVMFDLRALGARIVVDDFGTGFSALGYLRRHPVTGVKIDRAFVGGLGACAEDEEIVRAVVAMSAALGLTVVAEGVETTTQQDVLAALGVVLGQGRLWGSPVGPQLFTSHWSAPVALPSTHVALPSTPAAVPSTPAGVPDAVNGGAPTGGRNAPPALRPRETSAENRRVVSVPDGRTAVPDAPQPVADGRQDAAGNS